MNRTYRAGIVSSLSLFVGLLFALPLVATAQSEEAGQTEVASKDSGKPAAEAQERTESEFEPEPDLDRVIADPNLIEANTPEGEPPVPEHSGIEEIIVTAQKRSGNLQEVPALRESFTSQ